MNARKGLIRANLTWRTPHATRANSALECELLCWAKRPHDCDRPVHGLNSGINNEFNEAGIENPFPQQDFHIRGLPEGGRKHGSID